MSAKTEAMELAGRIAEDVIQMWRHQIGASTKPLAPDMLKWPAEKALPWAEALLAAKEATRKAQEWAAGYPLGGGMDYDAASEVYEVCRAANTLLQNLLPAPSADTEEPR